MKYITLLLLSFFITANASEQKSIKKIEVQSKKITVESEQSNNNIQSNIIQSVPLKQTIVTIDNNGKSHTQCDTNHNHEKSGELK